ncbi:unnamed protein product [Choristocarpus tenellus]
MVFVERRATARILCDYLNHCMGERLRCGFVVGRAKSKGGGGTHGTGLSIFGRDRGEASKAISEELMDVLEQDSEDDVNQFDEDDAMSVEVEGDEADESSTSNSCVDDSSDLGGGGTAKACGTAEGDATVECRGTAEVCETAGGSGSEEGSETAMDGGTTKVSGTPGVTRTDESGETAEGSGTTVDGGTTKVSGTTKGSKTVKEGGTTNVNGTAEGGETAEGSGIDKSSKPKEMETEKESESGTMEGTADAKAGMETGEAAGGTGAEGGVASGIKISTADLERLEAELDVVEIVKKDPEDGIAFGGAKRASKGVGRTINMFRQGELQVLVTTDACSEGIDVPECNLVISMDKIKSSRNLIHTRGRARSRGGRFIIMVEAGDLEEEERVHIMLQQSEEIKRNQLQAEKASKRIPFRQMYPTMVHEVDGTGAIVDMDMAIPLLHETLYSLGCDFLPLFRIMADDGAEGDDMKLTTSYSCRLELPTFLDLPNFDTRIQSVKFKNKTMARCGVAFLAVKELLKRKFIDKHLNPHRTKERLEIQTRKGYDPVVNTNPLPKSKAKYRMPSPRLLALGLPLIPPVDPEDARLAEFVGQRIAIEQEAAATAAAAAAMAKLEVEEKSEEVEPVPMEVAGEPSDEVQKCLGLVESVPAPASAHDLLALPPASDSTAMTTETVPVRNEESESSSVLGTTQGLTPDENPNDPDEWEQKVSSEGSKRWNFDENGNHPWGRAFPGGLRGSNVQCSYARAMGPKTTLHVHCLRSPPGELDGAVIGRLKEEEGDVSAGGAVKEASGGTVSKAAVEEEKTSGVGEKGTDAYNLAGDDYHTDWRTFDDASKVDLGRGEAVGLGPRLFVGLATAGPLKLSPSQEEKVGLLDSWTVEVNPAEMAALVQWHCDTIGMASVSIIPPQMSASPWNDPTKNPFETTGSIRDRGMLAVPLAFDGEDGVSNNPYIDWLCVEDCNTGRHLPDETDQQCVERVHFCRVSHKTCRFYFPLERLKMTLGEYLNRCEENGTGPYAGLPAEELTRHDVGKMGRTKDVLAVGHGCSKPDYEAGYKERHLLLCVPAPALRHSFAQHLIRGEREMDPDAGMRGRVRLKDDLLQAEAAAKVDKAAGGEDGADGDVVIAGSDSATKPMELEDEGDASTDSKVKANVNKSNEGEGEGGDEGEEEGGFQGVAMLKHNDHRPGRGQPVLLIEQYCQPICMSRLVFVSVLHVRERAVPRMFDLERQLLCSTLHKSLFRPALEAEVHARTSFYPSPSSSFPLAVPMNERLETLGDAWLNYYAALVVFQVMPVMREEGMMTIFRKNIVSNARLIKCAERRGLQEFMYPPRCILGTPFMTWVPSLLPAPPPVMINRKTIADVVEAMLGACLVVGGNRSASCMMEWLGLPTLDSTRQALTPSPAMAPASSNSSGDTKGSITGHEQGAHTANGANGEVVCDMEGSDDVTAVEAESVANGGGSVASNGVLEGKRSKNEPVDGDIYGNAKGIVCGLTATKATDGMVNGGEGRGEGVVSKCANGNGSPVMNGHSAGDGHDTTISGGVNSFNGKEDKAVRTGNMEDIVKGKGNSLVVNEKQVEVSGIGNNLAVKGKKGDQSGALKAEIGDEGHDKAVGSGGEDKKRKENEMSSSSLSDDELRVAEDGAPVVEGVEGGDGVGVVLNSVEPLCKRLRNLSGGVSSPPESGSIKEAQGGGREDMVVENEVHEKECASGFDSKEGVNGFNGVSTLKTATVTNSCEHKGIAGVEGGNSVKIAVIAGGDSNDVDMDAGVANGMGSTDRSRVDKEKELEERCNPSNHAGEVEDPDRPWVWAPPSYLTESNTAVSEKTRGEEGSRTWWPIPQEKLMRVEKLAERGVIPKVFVTRKHRPNRKMMGHVQRVERSLGYRFIHPWLCVQATTHPSWTMFDQRWNSVENDSKKDGWDDGSEGDSDGIGEEIVLKTDKKKLPAQDYQRFEFLGDAVLGYLVTAQLYFLDSRLTPAQLTSLKASCVCNASLYVIALQLNLQHAILASPAILASIQGFVQNPTEGGPPKHVADVFEALVAAVYLDSSCSMSTVSRVFWPLIAKYLEEHPLPVDQAGHGVANLAATVAASASNAAVAAAKKAAAKAAEDSAAPSKRIGRRRERGVRKVVPGKDKGAEGKTAEEGGAAGVKRGNETKTITVEEEKDSSQAESEGGVLEKSGRAEDTKGDVELEACKGESVKDLEQAQGQTQALSSKQDGGCGTETSEVGGSFMTDTCPATAGVGAAVSGLTSAQEGRLEDMVREEEIATAELEVGKVVPMEEGDEGEKGGEGELCVGNGGEKQGGAAVATVAGGIGAGRGVEEGTALSMMVKENNVDKGEALGAGQEGVNVGGNREGIAVAKVCSTKADLMVVNE